MNAFFDTNVLIDVLAYRQPFYDDSARAWALVEKGRAQGCIAAVAVTTVYYIVKRRGTHGATVEMLRDLCRVFEPVACDAQLLAKAMDTPSDDFEDAVQLVSARAANADAIVTRDPDGFAKAKIRVMTPAELVAEHGQGS